MEPQVHVTLVTIEPIVNEAFNVTGWLTTVYSVLRSACQDS